MWRAIGGVILGYVAMAVIIMITFTVMFLVLGTDGSFAEGSYEPSMLWNVLSLILSLVAAVVGGLLCAMISKGGRAPKVLAGIILVLGLLMGVMTLQQQKEQPDIPRESEIALTDAMQNARSPVWSLFATPFVGVIGVLIGASLRGSPKS